MNCIFPWSISLDSSQGTQVDGLNEHRQRFHLLPEAIVTQLPLRGLVRPLGATFRGFAHPDHGHVNVRRGSGASRPPCRTPRDGRDGSPQGLLGQKAGWRKPRAFQTYQSRCKGLGQRFGAKVWGCSTLSSTLSCELHGSHFPMTSGPPFGDLATGELRKLAWLY